MIELMDVYSSLHWVGQQTLSVSGMIPVEWIGIGSIFLLSGAALVLREPKRHRVVPWTNIYGDSKCNPTATPDVDREVRKQLFIDHVLNDPEVMKKLSVPVEAIPAVTQVRYGPRSQIQESNPKIDELKRKKAEFMARKREFLADPDMIDEYQRRIDEYDKSINKLYHESKINSIIDSINNPTLETVHTTPATTIKRISARQFVPDAEYKRYIHSNVWKKRSRAYKEQLNGKCEQCGKDVGIKGLQVHHISYCENLARDDNESFWAGICKTCHAEYRRTTQGDKSKWKKE